jgi:O-antigen/teichoic acid export membrane protein
VLVLGHASRFEDAAAFSIALTIPLILVVSSGTVIALQYYPQLSQMLADPRSDTRSHFDSLYRVLAWAGLSVCSMLCFYPQTIISVLFTARYSAAVEPMISLASAAAVVPIGQFALWTLLARGQRGWPVLGLLAQLVALLPFIGAALIWPELPLWVLGLGHTLAAGVALATWIMGLRQQRVQCSWRPRRVAVAAVVALASAAALRVGSPDGLNGGVNGVVLLASTGLVVAGVTAIVIWSDELIPRLHRRWPALLRGSASSSAARAPAATRCLREVPLARTSSDPTENATPTVSTR